MAAADLPARSRVPILGKPVPPATGYFGVPATRVAKGRFVGKETESPPKRIKFAENNATLVLKARTPTGAVHSKTVATRNGRCPNHGGRPMQHTYDDLADLARACAKQAHFTSDPEVAQELWRMAREYQRRAADLNDGKPPDIGDAPSWVSATKIAE